MAQPRAPLHSKVMALPLSFAPNVGQGGAAQYVARGPGYAISLDAGGAALGLGPDLLRLRLAGSRADHAPEGEAPLPGRVNYYIGNDRSKWRENVPTFGKVRYARAYRGIDLVYYGTQGRLEYDFDVAPGASPAPITLDFDGAERISLDAVGNLHVAAHGHDVIFDRPIAYQMDGVKQQRVPARYRVRGRSVGFEVGAHDLHKALIIDPVLDYFSYLGGSGSDVIGVTSPQASQISGQAAALDGSGDLYVVGYTNSTNFPTRDPFGPMPVKTGSGSTVFVTKFSPDAGSVIFSTYLGGTLGSDVGYGIAVDSSGNAFVVGGTGSNDFPVTSGAYQTICSPNWNNSGGVAESQCSGTYGSQSAFVSKFGPTGALLASTFLGGTGTGNAALAVTVDSAGRAYVAGYTYPGENIPSGVGGEAQAVGFPTTTGAVVSPYNYSSTEPINGALQYDAFVTVFNPSLSALVYSTLIGDDRPFSAITANGSQSNTYGTAVTVDASGNFYLAGYTGDNYLPTTSGSYEPNPLTCGRDDAQTTQFGGYCGFVSKFTAVGGASAPGLTYATYLGGEPASAGSFVQQITGIAADAAGDAYVVGYANSAGFPTTAGAYQPTCDGYDNATSTGDFDCNAAFVAKLSPTGATLLASTYLGCVTCSGDAMATTGAIVLDAANDVYIGGYGGNGLPLVNGTASNNSSGGQAPYVAELDSGLTTLKFSSFINVGNAGQISPGGLALDATGAIYVAGSVNSPASSAATAGAFQSSYGGGSSDGFVAKLSPTVPTTTTLTTSSTALTAGTALTLTATVAAPSGSATPTGTVTFKDGTTTLGTMTLNATGIAAYSTSTLAVGSHALTAAYGGSTADAGSTSSAVSVTIAAPAAPTVQIGVAPTSVTLAQSATLTWSSTGATSCTASGAWTGSEAASGTATETPTSAGSFAYTLTCTGAGGTSDATATLTVTAPAPTVTIAVAPTSITVGGSATLTWSSTNATSCTASGGWSGTEATSGTLTETPTAAGTDTYTLACTGAGGTGTASAALQIAAATTSSSHGGGALDRWSLLGLVGLMGLSWRARRTRTAAGDGSAT